MDLLRRALAPIVDPAWTLIEEEARRVLEANLSARRVVDVAGPHGWRFAAVDLGTLEVSSQPLEGGLCWGVRKVQPLVEVRVPFELDLWSFDDVDRGARAPDLSAVATAARHVARFEERAIYHGFSAGGIVGLAGSGPHPVIPLPAEASHYPDAVARALLALHDAGVREPYALVLGPDPWRALSGDSSAYPPKKQIMAMIGGPVIPSPGLDGGFVLPLRGGDFELTLGQDVSIGYETHDTRTVRLYLTESFTFRVITPEAVVRLAAAEV